MAEDPRGNREAIEATREELAETLEALGSKADVRGRAEAKLEEQAAIVRDRASEATEKVARVVPDPVEDRLRQGAHRLEPVAEEARQRPLLVAGIAVGVLLVLRRARRRARRRRSDDR